MHSPDKIVFKYFNIWYFLILIPLYSFAIVHSFRLDISTYQDCTFKLLGSTYDDRSEIFLTSNQFGQTWTISTWEFKTVFYPHPSTGFSELCSVNIIFSVNLCFHPLFTDRFLPKHYLSTAIFVIVIDSSFSCSTPTYGHITELLASYFVFKISSDKHTHQTVVTTQLALCPSCAWEIFPPFLKMEFTISLRDLVQQLERSGGNYRRAPVKVLSSLSGSPSKRIITKASCPYQVGFGKRTKFIRCHPAHIILENLAVKLNFSIKYISVREYLRTDPMADDAIGLASFSDAFMNTQDPATGAIRTKFLFFHDTSLHLAYCVKKVRTQHFDVLFWFYPFDPWVWACGILCYVNLSVAIKLLQLGRKPKLSIKGRIFALSFACALAVYYESQVSSVLTVPAKEHIFNSLRELFRNGYKVFGISSKDYEYPTVVTLARRERMSVEELNLNLIPSPEYEVTSTMLGKRLAGCKVTMFSTQTVSRIPRFLSTVNNVQAGLTCYSVSSSKVVVKDFYFTEKHISGVLYKYLSFIHQVGIYNLISDVNSHSFDNSVNHFVEQKKKERRRARSLEIEDWKILSIFLAWLVLLGGSLVLLISSIVWESFVCFPCRRGSNKVITIKGIF